ncbi:MAG TPA: prepilin-type N-terminal cleavage/methylation domain-containing protein [Myxococcaceae bacterium]|nr:prepilin-type N-terminal cleavage/methylation domain-containing protein [Myxococcaceae bacterium]
MSTPPCTVRPRPGEGSRATGRRDCAAAQPIVTQGAGNDPAPVRTRPRDESRHGGGTCLAPLCPVPNGPHPRRADHASAGVDVRRGFTVLEMMVAVSIVSLMAAMSLSAYQQFTARADFSSVLGNLVTNVRLTRSEAAGRGVATAFIVDTRNNRWWGVEAPTGWNLGSFDPGSPGTVIAFDTFPTGTGKTVFGPTTGYGSALPAPFATVPVIAGQNPSLPFCSFCDPGTGMGAIVFQPNGAASFAGSPPTGTALGQQFTVQSPTDGRTVLLAVIGRTGMVEVFDR